MRRLVLLFILFAVLFPVGVSGEFRYHAGGAPDDGVLAGKCPAMEKYQLAQAARNDSGVSTKLPFNFLNGIYMSRCMESSRLGEFDSAIETCSKAIELDPGNIFAHRLRGLAYEKTGNPRKAAQDCEAAEKLGDGECRSWLQQASHTENEKEGTLSLMCRVSFDGGPPGDYSLVVDLAKGTVNGWKASIDDNVIRWKQKGAWFRVDRYTGVFDGANANDTATYTGKCVRTMGKRQF